MEILAASEANIQAVMSYPPLILRVLAPDDRAAFAEAHNAFGESTSSMMGKLLGRRRPTAEEVRLPDASDTCIYLDLDMAWHGLHFLFTRTQSGGDPPLNFLLGGGGEIPEIDVGYGVSRLFPADRVREIESALAQITDDEFRGRYSPEDLFVKDERDALELDSDLAVTEELPEASAEGIEDKYSLEYLMKYLALLRTFLQKAVEQRRGIVVY